MTPEDLKPLDPRIFKEVHFRIGLALWGIQAFEEILTYFITLILKLPPDRREAEARSILEDLQTKTLGQLINELRKGNTSSSVSEFEQRVRQFLKARNWLVHSSWRECSGHLFDMATATPLIQKLDGIATEADDLKKAFAALVHQWTLAQGHTQEEIDERTREILKQRGLV